MKHIAICDCKHLIEYFCDTCCLGKHHKLPFKPSTSIASQIFDMLHVDLWGPYRTQAITGGNYFLTVVDDHSKVTWTHLLSNKEQVRDVLKMFFVLIENHFKTTVKVVRSDNGTKKSVRLQYYNGREGLHIKGVWQGCHNKMEE